MKKLTLLIVMLLATVGAKAGIQNPENAKYYGVFVYQFSKYTVWPASMAATETFVIGVMGNTPIKEGLDQLAAAKKINNRQIVVKTISNTDEIAGCHLLFVPNSSMKQLPSILKATVRHSVLLITEANNGAAKGAVINFIEENGKLSFEISVTNATRHGLKLSSNLQQLGRMVS